MPKIYAEITPKLTGLFTCYRKPRDYMDIYELIRSYINDHYSQSEAHLIAERAASWCELACIGKIYDQEFFTIKIIEE